MSVKAKLKVILQANDVIVAEVEDPVLWQKVLTAINTGDSELIIGNTSGGAGSGGDPGATLEQNSATGAIEKFAKQLGVQPELVAGAFYPTTEAPYMVLDMHCWEEMKKQTPERGPTAFSPIGIVATVLALWFKNADLGSVTQAQAQTVLGFLNKRDPNPSRGIQRSPWLQARAGGAVVLNPAQISRSIQIAKSFCSKNWGSK